MNAMVLCPGCKRHVFAGESACPFCGIGFASTNPVITPNVGADLSRAQRYVVGAAIAVSVAAVGCTSPTVVRNPDEAGDVTVDVNNTDSNHQQRESLEVARDPNQADTVVNDDEARRRQQEEQARREAERQRQLQQQEEWQQRNRWRHQGNPCVNGVCPPYGCVFPDESCDTLRV